MLKKKEPLKKGKVRFIIGREHDTPEKLADAILAVYDKVMKKKRPKKKLSPP